MMEAFPEKDRIAGFEVHPFANIFPMFGEGELVELQADIEKNGLAEPVVLYMGKILNGRNRAKVCEVLGIMPQTVEYTSNDPFAYVVSKNLHRRHLTTSQRSMIAGNLQVSIWAIWAGNQPPSGCVNDNRQEPY